MLFLFLFRSENYLTNIYIFDIFKSLKGVNMKSLIADRVKRNNEKIKSQANKNKKLIANGNKNNYPTQSTEQPKPVMKESKTLMLEL